MAKVDLNLWMDQEIVRKQNKLKSQLWSFFSDLGNELAEDIFVRSYEKTKGVKLTKGNDLLGFPYHVLDIMRDFEANSGINIRILNWFGHGLFVFVYTGKHLAQKLAGDFYKLGYYYARADSPFDYPGIILEGKSSLSPNIQTPSEGLNTWFSQIESNESVDVMKSKLKEETAKLIYILDRNVGKS